MYYNISMEKKAGNNMNNIHHCYNPMQHTQAKASCKGRCQQKPKRQKQSWVIDKKYKTNYLNTTKNIILIAIITLPLLLFMYASYKFTTLGAIIIFSPFVCFLISFLLLASFLKDILK